MTRALQRLAGLSLVAVMSLAQAQPSPAQADRELFRAVAKAPMPFPKARLVEGVGIRPQFAITNNGSAISFRYLNDGRLDSIIGPSRRRDFAYEGPALRPAKIVFAETDARGARTTHGSTEARLLRAVEAFNRTHGEALREAIAAVQGVVVKSLPASDATMISRVAKGATSAPITAMSAALREPTEELSNPFKEGRIPGLGSGPGGVSPDPFGPGPGPTLLCETPFSCAACVSVCIVTGSIAKAAYDLYRPAPGDPPSVQAERLGQWADCQNEAQEWQDLCTIMCI